MQEYGTPLPGVLGSGHNVWPLKLVTELVRIANESGSLDLHLHTRTPVTAVSGLSAYSNLTSKFPRRWSLQSPRGHTSCSHVIFAANAYTPALIPELRGTEGIIPVRGQVIATRASVPAKGMSVSSFDSHNEYWFPRPVEDGEEKPLVIIGGAREFSETKELDTVDDSSVSEAVGDELRRYLPFTFPGMYEYGSKPEMEWVSYLSTDL
jgi:glycine/D-amino acid oxidase-like deaminating enzyme